MHNNNYDPKASAIIMSPIRNEKHGKIYESIHAATPDEADAALDYMIDRLNLKGEEVYKNIHVFPLYDGIPTKHWLNSTCEHERRVVGKVCKN